MPYLVAAVILVGVLVIIDLILTLGVIQRLREHARLLTQALEGTQSVADFMLPAGSPLPGLRATTVDGTAAPDTGPLLIGFFSPTCHACLERLPGFVSYADAFDGRVLGVAVGAPEDVGDIVAKLRGVADVVIEQVDGPLAKALQVKGMPAMATVGADGVVVASGFELAALPSLVTT
ncbi:thiol-disulfide isomerase/thioredoxin [Kibdelosporangium banguiense]|uniref:Thiol-disulfide isomerase/thioredoxin n=1 Tax=Kibdelosporangium banguiense TaxID=1365924 RepID=A0ABS4TUH6_9PSEU|nr:hypothetical protein [Kibdelosporangium banguiense]MBP2327581.1 thiol-disulfide isomerase/thioredoxin [Kibdelosporangium banguiense]